MTAPDQATWTVAEDADGDLTLWHGDIAVLRECDLATGGGGSATVARTYRRILFGLLGRVLAPDEATIERLAEAMASAHLDFLGDREIPHWGRHLVEAVLAALAAAAGPTDDEAVTPGG